MKCSLALAGRQNIYLTKYVKKHIYEFMNIKPSVYFSAISHEMRLRCLLLLLEHEELCVCEITHALDAAQPTVSRHLAQLRQAELVSDRREGLWIHYRINPQVPQWMRDVLLDTLQGVRGVAPFKDDIAALRSMPNRPGAPKCA